MYLTTKGHYAVLAMVDIALHSKGRPIPLSDIADRQVIALNYLEQIFMKLRRSGLVRSMRGPGGGYMLQKDKHHITIADIVRAVDETINVTRCHTKNDEGCMKVSVKCQLHPLWAGLTRHIERYLFAVTIGDVCDGTSLPKVDIVRTTLGLEKEGVCQ